MWRILCLAIILLLPNVANSAEQSIVLGSATLSLGMSEEQIHSKLDPYYRLDCKEGKVKSCVLMNKDGPPYSMKANIVFKNGKVTTIRKYWSGGYDGTDPAMFVKTFYNILSNMTKDGPITVILSTNDTKEPGVTSESIFITHGNKTININVTEGLQSGGKRIPTFTNLDEMLE
jgi:hypothetical protein